MRVAQNNIMVVPIRCGQFRRKGKRTKQLRCSDRVEKAQVKGRKQGHQQSEKNFNLH